MHQSRQQKHITFKMSRKDINFFGQLFKLNSTPKLWKEWENEIKLQDKIQSIYNQIIHSIPKCWKDVLTANSDILKTWFSMAIT